MKDIVDDLRLVSHEELLTTISVLSKMFSATHTQKEIASLSSESESEFGMELQNEIELLKAENKNFKDFLMYEIGLDSEVIDEVSKDYTSQRMQQAKSFDMSKKKNKK